MSQQYFFNFTILDEPIKYGELRFYSVEAFYQAMKTLDQFEREKMSHMTPPQVKKYGSKVKLRDNWDNIRADVMQLGIELRYRPDSFDAKKLLETNGPIVEWNRHHDIFFGRCLCDEHNDEGQNVLGLLLMERRLELSLASVA